MGTCFLLLATQDDFLSFNTDHKTVPKVSGREIVAMVLSQQKLVSDIFL